jgi:uncharacterized delta-60 repeat protein
MKRAILTLIFISMTALAFASPALAAPGDLHTSFGDDGVVTTSFTDAAGEKVRSSLDDVVLQPDGKIVAYGTHLVRYEADGTLDASFGDGGKAPAEGYGQAVVLQPDGKIVTAGSAYIDENTKSDFVVARYDADGVLDPTFGVEGKVSTDFGLGDGDQANSLLLQPDGKIVAAGYAYHRDLDRFMDIAVARYDADGALDASFGGDGRITTVVGPRFDQATATAIQPDGKLVVAGNSVGGDACVGCAVHRFAIARYYGGDDATAPGAVTGFKASLWNDDSALSWTNPADADFEATRILRSTSGHAASATQTTDQTEVYEGRGTAHLDAALYEDTYYYTAFAKDANGNWSLAARTITVTPLETTLNSWTNSPSPPNVTFGFESSKPKSTFQCKLDEGPFQACNSYKLYSGLSHGEHTFYVRAIDSAGNVDPTPATRTWTVDARGPEVTITSGPSGTVSAGSARFEFSTDEPAHRLLCELDNGGENYCASPVEYSNLASGEHTFYVQAVDEFGNQGPIVSRTWTVAPEITKQQLDAGATLSTDAEGDGATLSDPLETSITSPVGGAVSVAESAVLDPDSPGYSFLGQQANIEAPPSTADDPLRFVFRLDASLIPAGDDKDTIEVFRNGVLVQDCDGSANVASPDPCVLQRNALENGDVEFTVLTSHASHWNFGVADREVPKVESVTPSNLAKNVTAKTNVTVTFSEAMQVSTVNTGTFVLLKKGSMKSVGAKVTYSAATNKATLNPSRDLTPGATYVVTMKAGTIEDLAGNALERDMVWTFKVKK